MGHVPPKPIAYPDERILCEMDYVRYLVRDRGKAIVYQDGKPGIMTPWCVSSDCEYGEDLRFRPLSEEEMIYLALDEEFPGIRHSKNDITRDE